MTDLVADAKKVAGRVPRVHAMDEEHMRLALAYARGEVTYSGIAKVLKREGLIRTASNVEWWASRQFFRAIRQGWSLVPPPTNGGRT